jgi:superfamily II DNA/RNA helicase
VLVIAPTKELREQYVRMAEWMGHLTPRIVVLDFKEPISAVHKQVRIMVEQADIIVTTPEMFTNRLDWLSRRSFEAIQLCVLDEVICGSLTTSMILRQTVITLLFLS